MTRCAHCHGRFGLVRYRHFGKQFCSDRAHNRCKQRYLAEHGTQLSVRISQIGPNAAGFVRRMLSVTGYAAALRPAPAPYRRSR